MYEDRSEQALLEVVLETMASLVIVMDAKARVVLFNKACEELTGYKFSEVEGQVIWERVVPEDERAGVEATFEALSAGDFPNQFENDWLMRDGTRRRIEWSNSALTDAKGQVRLVVSTGVDITQRRAAMARERELLTERVAHQVRVSEEISSGIVEVSADAIVTVSADHRIRQFNKGAEEIFGYLASEVLGQPLSVLLPEYARPGHHDQMMTFAESEIAARRMGERGSIEGRRKNGEVFAAEASISKQDYRGEWLFTAVLRDVTDQRWAAEELERANRELSRSNADLEHFAAVASHDLQEPLRKIQAFGDRLESKFGADLPERGQDYLRRMQSAAGRMSALIQDLLAFSRVTTRAQPFEAVDLGEVVARVVEDLEVRIEHSGGRVEVGVLPRLDADAMQMRLLFQNLISNGLKFHRQEVAPVVVVRSEEAGEGQVRIVVEDNGVGFDEKYLDRIFDVFQRLHGRGVYEGTGMGLAIVRKIVERHGGKITAQSQPEEGARFLITLPVEQVVHAAEESRNDRD